MALSGGDDQPDWGNDEDEPQEEEKKPLAESESDEVMQRVLRLLEEQRLRSQAVVAKATDETTKAQLQDDAFAALLSPTPLAVLPIISQMDASTVLQVKEANGMTLLRTAARIGCWEVADAVLQLNPRMTEQLTLPSGRPSHWSALMVLIDSGAGHAEGDYKYIMDQVLLNSSIATIECRAANGSSALHMACSKGMLWSTKRIIYAVYGKANGDQAAYGLVTSMLNQTNGRGAGCASWLGLWFWFCVRAFFFRRNGLD